MTDKLRVQTAYYEVKVVLPFHFILDCFKQKQCNLSLLTCILNAFFWHSKWNVFSFCKFFVDYMAKKHYQWKLPWCLDINKSDFMSLMLVMWVELIKVLVESVTDECAPSFIMNKTFVKWNLNFASHVYCVVTFASYRDVTSFNLSQCEFYLIHLHMYVSEMSERLAREGGGHDLCYIR
jgi:hypothetical protein